MRNIKCQLNLNLKLISKSFLVRLVFYQYVTVAQEIAFQSEEVKKHDEHGFIFLASRINQNRGRLLSDCRDW